MPGRGERWAVLRRSLLWVLEASAVGLVASGVPLVWWYQPVGGPEWLRELHSTAAVLSLCSSVALVAVVAAGRWTDRDRATRVWLWGGLGAVGLAVAGLLTGPLLAWDQLARWAVTVGDDLYEGALAPFSGDVRFLFVDGREVSTGTYKIWAAVHIVVLPLVALIGTGLVLWRRPDRTLGARKRVSTGSDAAQV
jgi:quinol-cytochrome oxidoreductase complex cytochrome b subunit